MVLIGCPIDSADPNFFEQISYFNPMNTYNSVVNCEQEKKSPPSKIIQEQSPILVESLKNNQESNLEDLMKQQIFLLKLILLFLGFLVIGRFIDK